MPLITLRNAELAFGLHPLLDRAQFSVEDGERVGLIGRNGTGKSSLLKVHRGAAPLDDGELAVRDGLRIVLVEQEPELPPAATVRDSLIAARPARRRFTTSASAGASRRGSTEFLHRLGVDARTRTGNDVRRRAQARRARSRAGVASRTCCCSTSRRIISTSTASRRWKSCC